MFKKVIQFLYSQKIDLHSDILSLKEIQSAIKSVVETHEEKFIQQIKVGQYNPQLWLKIKRHYIEPNDAIRIIKVLGEQDQAQRNQLLNKTQTTQELIKNDIYNYFIKYFSKKYEKLTFSQIAIVLEQYAYVKRFDQDFFRIMENEIYDRLSDKNEIIKYQDVEKILWAYQYCHYGSAILYGQLASVIKIAQHEINPLKLAYYSYLYSKCPDNQKGGFGIYAATEKQVQQRIRDYTFSDFIKLAQYIFTPNICSNAFQLIIEEQLAEQFPSNKNLLPHDLVKLCRATMTYYFKYNDRSLQHKIEGACIELIDKVNDKQFCSIFWSFLKSRKGNAELYKKFSDQLMIRQNLLSIRQLTLLYLNASNNSETFDLTKLLNEIIVKKLNADEQQQIKPTYLAYITIASMQSKLQIPIQLTSEHLKQISTPLKVAILQTLQMSLPHLDQIKLSILLIQNLQETELPYEDQVILHYCSQYFYKFCSQKQIQIKQSIHKSLFHQALYIDPQNEHLHNQLIVLNQQYKDEMRFFFKQDNWVVIAWCLLQEHLLTKERVIKKELIQEACMGIKELDINTIFHIDKYVESLWMVILIEKLNLEVGIEKISQFIKVSHYAQTSVLLNNFKDSQLLELKDVLKESLQKQCKDISLKQEFNQSYINMFDQGIGMMLHVTHLIKTKTQNLKFGLIVLDPQDFEMQLNEEKNIQIRLGEQDYNLLKHLRKERQIQRLLYEQLFDWNVEYIYLEEFQSYSKQQQLDYFNNVFGLNPLEEEDVERVSEKISKKGLNFQDKLNSFKQQKNRNRYEQTETNELIENDLNFDQ
ncbi:unnamed protein product [Paramecium octaurelia]|uniref:Uncharacterized protein n=1 Tax=Paramecium octaurelia TaxID=43137 RepID=A0A8S1SKK6_PAROT|nr:unnamed protein product [Paramecium octaurelia]